MLTPRLAPPVLPCPRLRRRGRRPRLRAGGRGGAACAAAGRTPRRAVGQPGGELPGEERMARGLSPRRRKHVPALPSVPWCNWLLHTAMTSDACVQLRVKGKWLLRPASLACPLSSTCRVPDPASMTLRRLPPPRQGDGFPELRATLWQGEGSVAGAVQGLVPQMTENRKKVGAGGTCSVRGTRQVTHSSKCLSYCVQPTPCSGPSPGSTG